jgi:hypothetical protein
MFHMSRLRFIEPQLASPVDQPPEGKPGFTKSNTMTPALYPNALYCDCGKCSAVEDTMLEESTGALALVVDKWKVSEPEIEYAGRGLGIPDDDTEVPAEGSYVGTYKYKNGSLTGSGTGTETFKGGDTTNYTWEEGPTEGTYKYTGGTGKYKGVSGGGTYKLYAGYTYEIVPGTLQVCKYKDQIVLP